MKPTPWNTQGHFLSLLALACAANYKGESPDEARPQEGHELIGKANETARCLNALRVDLLARRDDLAAKSREAARKAPAIISRISGNLRSIGDALTGLGNLAKQEGQAQEDIATLNRQIHLVGVLTHAVLTATTAELAVQKRDALFIGADGNVYGAIATEDTESYAIPQDHLVRQVGHRIILIIAGEDRLEAVLGIANPPKPFGVSFDQVEELEAQAQLGDLEALVTIDEDEVFLRRIAGLLNAVTQISFGASVSIATVSGTQRSLSEACEAARLVKELFWSIAKERYAELVGQKRLRLRDDWAVVQEEPSLIEELFGSALGAIPVEVRGAGGLLVSLAGFAGPNGCGDPNCEACADKKANGDDQPGDGERETAPAAATAGA